MKTLCAVLSASYLTVANQAISLALRNFAKLTKISPNFRYLAKIHFARIAKFSLYCENFLLLLLTDFFIPGFNMCTQTAKFNARKILKNYRKVKINLKTKID